MNLTKNSSSDFDTGQFSIHPQKLFMFSSVGSLTKE